MLLDQVLQRDAHLILNHTWVVYVPADAEDFGTLVPLPPKARKPAPATTADSWSDGDSLNISNGRGAAEEPDVGWEGRLQTRLALLSLDGLDQRRLLAADVRSCAPVQVHVERVARATRVRADEARFVCLIDRLLDVVGLLDEFTTNVDVC